MFAGFRKRRPRPGYRRRNLFFPIPHPPSALQFCANSDFEQTKMVCHKQNVNRNFHKQHSGAIDFTIFVNFRFSVRGNDAFQATVDGIEFASENMFAFVFVLSIQVYICELGMRCPPVPPISMLGKLFCTCELDSITHTLV